MNKVRTRIAPSPTGYPHIGTIYQALFNYAFAKKNTGAFIVRIEDTDRARFVAGAEEVIFSALDWFLLPEDESPRKNGPFAPYRQSERLEIYQKYAKELVKKGNAYYCFCSKERLDQLRKEQLAKKELPRYDKHCLKIENAQLRIDKGEPYVIRLNVEPGKKVAFDDLVRGKIEFDSSQIDDQVLLKSDGFPTYHLGVVVDDHLMEINYVVRGEEWIPSTPKHVLLYQAFGWDLPVFCHTPTLRNPDKSKLSKRYGHTDVRWYEQEGFLPEAILNYLALLGWSHKEEKEIFSLEEFIQLFDLKDVRAAAPIFDVQKLTWMNGEYIRMLSDEKLKQKLLQFYAGNSNVLKILNGDYKDMYVSLAKLRMKTLKDFETLVQEPAKKPKLSAEQHQQVQKLLEQLKSSNIEWSNIESLLSFLKSLKEQGLTMKQIYFFIMHKEQGLPLIELMQFWRKEEVLRRLESLLS